MDYPITNELKSPYEKLVSLILATTPVEKMYVIGCTRHRQITESIFLTAPQESPVIGHYYLLLLVDNRAGNSNNEIQDKIENNCKSILPVTALVLQILQFNNWLLAGHRFACTVTRLATLIHNSNNMPLADPVSIPYEAAVKEDDPHVAGSLNRVKEFIAGAEMFKIRMQNKMAAFMLHQAAEHALLAIFKTATGLHINTHSIDKLIRYCTFVSHKIPALFPRNTERNEKRFQLLQKAYIDTRYKDDYTINTNDLLAIMEQVNKLYQLAQETIA